MSWERAVHLAGPVALSLIALRPLVRRRGHHLLDRRTAWLCLLAGLVWPLSVVLRFASGAPEEKAFEVLDAVSLFFGGVLFANRAHLGSFGSTTSAAAAAAPVAPPPVTAAPPPPAPTPAPSPAATTPPADTAAAKLSDEQKARLSAADKALEAKNKAHKKSRGAAVPASNRKYKSQGFTTGGNKFDPLNASM